MVSSLEEEKQPNRRQKQTEHTLPNPKKHISPVSLCFCQKMVGVHCFLVSSLVTVVSEQMSELSE